MKHVLLSLVTLSATLLASGCGSSMKNPDIKQNPYPKMRYEITLTVQDAPGRFDSADISVRYRVRNDSCVPLQPISGARLSPEKEISVPLEHVDRNTYRGLFYTDALQEEDYFGLGVCHWEVNIIGFRLNNGKTRFRSFAPAADIANQGTSIRHFSKSPYLDTNQRTDSPEKSNDHDPSRVRYIDPASADEARQHPQGYFTTSLSIKESFQ